MKKKLISLVLILTVFIPHFLFAWSREGHHMVIEVAYQLLSKSAKEKLMVYLGGTSIQDASTWMDEQRGNNKYRFLTTTHYINIDKGGTFNPFQKNTKLQALYLFNEIIDSILKNNRHSQKVNSSNCLISFCDYTFFNH